MITNVPPPLDAICQHPYWRGTRSNYFLNLPPPSLLPFLIPEVCRLDCNGNAYDVATVEVVRQHADGLPAYTLLTESGAKVHSRGTLLMKKNPKAHDKKQELVSEPSTGSLHEPQHQLEVACDHALLVQGSNSNGTGYFFFSERLETNTKSSSSYHGLSFGLLVE